MLVCAPPKETSLNLTAILAELRTERDAEVNLPPVYDRGQIPTPLESQFGHDSDHS